MIDLAGTDLTALAWFIAAWLGFNVLVELTPLKRRTLSYHMNMHRRGWMEMMSRRPVRIMDVGIAAGLQQGTGFFASTSLLAIGGCFALLTSTDSILKMMSDLGLKGGGNPALWELKVIGLTLIYAYAFFKFGWAYRLFNYATILMGRDAGRERAGRAPPRLRREVGRDHGARRHTFQSRPAGVLLLGRLSRLVRRPARVFMATTFFVVCVLARRQFRLESKGAGRRIAPAAVGADRNRPAA